MRFSSQPSAAPVRIDARTNLEFFRQVAAKRTAEQCRAAVLLVGANDVRSLAVRQAQAPLRYDRRSSYFSHAALIVSWNTGAPEESVGLEASLDTDGPESQPVPERNGVTRFKLRRYQDETAYPNAALVTVELKATTQLDIDGKRQVQLSSSARKDAILDAARNPLREREVYPLWDGLGVWSKFRFSPERTVNPLLDNVPLPAAAYCEYAYAAQQIDIVPGAVARQTCPEMLWATFLRWQQGLLATTVSAIQVYVAIRDEQGIAPPPLPMELPF